MNREMSRDLGRHLQVEIGKVVHRHVATARLVLEPFEITLMIVEAAIGLSLSAAATAGHAAKEGAADGLQDTVVDAICKAISSKHSRERMREAARTGVGTL